MGRTRECKVSSESAHSTAAAEATNVASVLPDDRATLACLELLFVSRYRPLSLIKVGRRTWQVYIYYESSSELGSG